LAAIALFSGGCTDLNLRGALEGARADTTADSSSRATESRATRKESSRIDPQIAAASFSAVRQTLRRLVAAEETFYAETGTYTDDLSQIGFKPDQNTSVRFLRLSRDGWAARGAHTALAGRDCVIFVGRTRAAPTTLKYRRRGREGVPVCDDDSRRPPKPVAAAPPAKAPPAPPVDTTSQLDLLDPRVVMKVDLRNLAHSQETYFAMQGFYARRTQSLALQYLWHRDVQVRILEADAQSWAAQATHARFPGKSCVIWFGAVAQRPRTALQQRGESRAGVPVCDD
jgi:hypothetical protein